MAKTKWEEGATEVPETNKWEEGAIEVDGSNEKKNSFSQQGKMDTSVSTSKPLIFKDALEQPLEQSQVSAYAPRYIESEPKKPVFDPIEHTRIEIEKNNQSIYDLDNAFKQNEATLKDLDSQYNDPTLPTNTKNLVANEYNNVAAKQKEISNTYNQLIDRSSKLEVRRKALLAPSELREEAGVDAFDGFLNALKRGNSEGKVVGVMSDREFVTDENGTPVIQDKPYTDDEIKKISDEKVYQKSLKSSKAYKEWEKESPSSAEYWTKLASDPFEIIGQLSAESMATMVRHGITKAPSMAAKGAVIGSVVPGLGTLAMAGAGLTAGMGLTGLNMEVSASILESLTDAGIDVTNPDSLKKGFQNKELMDEAKSHAYKRGVPIAIMNMVSLGIAGKVISKAATKSLGKKVLSGGIEMAEQTVLDAGGEIAAQLIADQKLDSKEIMAEVLGGQGVNIATIGVGAIVEAKKQGKKIFSDATKLDVPKEQFNEMVDVSVGMGDITKEQSDEIKTEYAEVSDAKDKIPVEHKENPIIINAVIEKNKLQQEADALTQKFTGFDAVFLGEMNEKMNALNEKMNALDNEIQNELEKSKTVELDATQATQPIELDITPKLNVVQEPIVEGVEQTKEEVIEPPVIEQTTADVGWVKPADVSPIKTEEITTPLTPLEQAESVSGKTASEKAKEENFEPANDVEWVRYVAENSNNPIEIAKLFTIEQRSDAGNLSAKDQKINESNVTFTEEEFKQHTGLGTKDLTPAQKAWIDNNPIQSLDQQLQGLDENLTLNDYFDFIQTVGNKSISPETQTNLDRLADAYYRETGRRLNNRELKAVLGSRAEKVAKGYNKYVAEGAIESEQAQKAIDEMIANQSEKEIAKEELMSAWKRFSAASRSSMSSGGLQALPEFVELVKAIVKYTGVSAKQFVEKVREITPESVEKYSNEEIEGAFNSVRSSEFSGRKKSETDKLRADLGLEPIEPPVRDKNMRESAAAAAAVIKDDITIGKQRVEDVLFGGKKRTNDDVHIIGAYLSALNAMYDSNQDSDVLREIDLATKALKYIGSDASYDFNALKQYDIYDTDTLADWTIQLKEALGIDGANLNLTQEENDAVKQLHKEFTEDDAELEKIRETIEKDLYNAKAEIDRLNKEIQAERIKGAKQRGKSTKWQKRSEKAANWVRKRLEKEPFTIELEDADGNKVTIDETTSMGFSQKDLTDLIAKAIVGTGKIADKVENAIQEIKDSEFYQKLSPKSREDFKRRITEYVEREEKSEYLDFRDSAIEKLENGTLDRSSAADIKGMVRDIVRNGETNPDKIVAQIKEDLKGLIDEKQIFSVIEGRYSTKITHSELMLKMRDLRDYASLVRKYNALINGESIEEVSKRPLREKQDIARMRKTIEDLEISLGLRQAVKTGGEKAIARKEKRLQEIKDGVKKVNNKPVYTASEQAQIDALEKEIYDEKVAQGLITPPKTEGEKAIDRLNKRIADLLMSKQKTSAAKTFTQQEQQQIDDLKKQVEDLVAKEKKANKIASGMMNGGKAKTTKQAVTDEQKLDRMASYAEKAIKEIEHKISIGDFSKNKRVGILSDPAVRAKFPNKVSRMTEILRKKRAAKNKFQELKIRKELSEMPILENIHGAVKKTLNTIGKINATLDLSFIGIHGQLVMFTNPVLWTKTFIQETIRAFSKDKFHQSIEQLRDDEALWDIIEGSGLDIIDIDAIKENQRDDMLRKTWFDEHSLGGMRINIGKYLGTEVSDRAFTAMGNAMRLGIAKPMFEELAKEGKSIYTHPEDFKAVAKYVNNLTGRGVIPKELNNEAVNQIIWSPKKLAARFSTLGLSDAVHYVKDRNRKRKGEEVRGFYRSLTPKMQKQAAKDFIKIAAGGMLIMGAAKLFLGAEVDDDEESKNFGFIKLPNGLQYDVFGELSSVVRAMYKMARIPFSEDKKKQVDAPLRYVRGKLSPMSRMMVDMWVGEDYMGAPVYDEYGEFHEQWLKDQVSPMSIKGILNEFEIDKGKGAMMTPFLVPGLPLRDQESYDRLMEYILYEKDRIKNAKKDIIENDIDLKIAEEMRLEDEKEAKEEAKEKREQQLQNYRERYNLP